MNSRSLLLALLLPWWSPLLADKLLVEDFADCGTWRTCYSKNTTPGTWFSADQCLSGVPDASRADGFAGKLMFDFQGANPGQLAFLRAKASQADVFADGIEFDADFGKIPGSVRFMLKDSANKTFMTPEVAIKTPDWQHYRVEINAGTIKDYKKMVFPVRMFRVYFQSPFKGRGAVLIDDIALTGSVSKKRQLGIFPVLGRLDNPPEKSFDVSYRLANARKETVKAVLSMSLKDFFGREVHRYSDAVVLPGYGRNCVSVTIPPLPVGSYYAELKLVSGALEAGYTDWIGVFKGNQGRLNRQPMWFGAQDTNIWNGPEENRLHQEWLKLIGIDLVRFGVTGSRLDNGPGADGFPSVARILAPLAKDHILVCLSYGEGTPSYLQSGKPDHRAMPDKMEAFAAHVRKVFTFLKQYPNVRYFEWWNEPDIGFLRSNLDDYLKALKVLYPIAKSIAPEIAITTGGVTVIHPREKKNFSRDMYQQGKGLYDVACFHAHGSLSNYVTRNEKVEEWLNAVGSGVSLCNTETGERSGYTVDTIKRQAAVLVKKITYAKSRHTEFYVWFTLQDYWDMDFEADDSFGLVNSDNRAKPSFIAYNELIRQLADTERGSKVELTRELEAYRFIHPKTRDVTLVCWPKIAGLKSSFTLRGTGRITISNMFGRSRSVTATNGLAMVPVDGFPTYIRYTANTFKPSPSLIAQDGLSAGAAGNVATIRLKLRNIFPAPATFLLSAADAAPVRVNLPASGEGAAELNVPIRKGRKNGVISVEVKAEIVSGNKHLTQQLPVSVNVCYPVARNAPPAESIVIDNLDQVQELTFDPSIPKWNGRQDLSATFSATTDGHAMNIVVKVNDDRHVLTHQPSEAWRDDSVQIGFANLAGQDTILTVSGSDGKGAVWCHTAIRPELEGQWRVPVGVTREGNFTVYRFSLPLANLGIAGQAGTPFRFSFLVNENDGQGRVRWIEWFGGIGRSKNHDEFGWGVLQ